MLRPTTIKYTHYKINWKAKVGSVDKFQGQEAPIVILSLATSNAQDTPKGLGFLLDKNRLNVAISRAQSLAIVVASPHLADGFNGSIEDMKLINLYCKRLLIELFAPCFNLVLLIFCC